jgi:hypothetical protein
MAPEIRRRGVTTRIAIWSGSAEARLLAQAAASVGADAAFNKPPDVKKLVAWISGASPGGDELPR